MNHFIKQNSAAICKKYNLEPWHVELLNYAMLPKALRPSYIQMAARLGVKVDTFYYWLRNPAFNKARAALTKQYYQDDVPDVLMAMRDEAMAGNERAARLFLEYVQDWNKNPNNPADEDVEDPLTIVKVNEAKKIIINLQQKFYGSAKAEIKENTENVVEAEVS